MGGLKSGRSSQFGLETKPKYKADLRDWKRRLMTTTGEDLKEGARSAKSKAKFLI